jgi:hypothetical protein
LWALSRLTESSPAVGTYCTNWKFPGERQRETPVADARGIVEFSMLLPGRSAADFRKQAASVMVRYLGGDLSLVEEVASIRLAQERLPENHPARLLGHTVDSEAVKRMREELEIVELEGRIKRVRAQMGRRCWTC